MLRTHTALDEDTVERAHRLIAEGKYSDFDDAVEGVLRGESQTREGWPDAAMLAQLREVLERASKRTTPPVRDEAALEKWRQRLHGCLGDRTLEEVMDELRGRGRAW